MLALLLSGCMGGYIETPPVALVEPVPHVLLLTARPGGHLPPAEHRRLTDFIYTASSGRLDAVHLRVIGVSPRARYAAIRTAMRMGVAQFKIREVDELADEFHRYALRIVAVKHVAHAPVCPSLAITGPSFIDNNFEPTAGCSNLNNLAAMVNDPKDLLVNTAVPPSDGERAAIPVARHRTFAGAGTAAGSTSSGGGQTAPGSVPPVNAGAAR